VLAIPPRIIATCFAFVAFAAGVVVGGFGAGNDFVTVIYRATMAMIACGLAGYGIGWALTYVTRLQINAHKQTHPLPDLHNPGDAELSGASDSTEGPEAYRAPVEA
jgi:hypothetical protein